MKIVTEKWVKFGDKNVHDHYGSIKRQAMHNGVMEKAST